MKIVFASAHPYPPQIAGGSQSNTHEMAMELIARGHEVAVLAGLTRDGWIGKRGRLLMRLRGNSVVRDKGQGYPVYRAWFAWQAVAEMVRRERPDVAVAQSGSILRLARAFRQADVPAAIYLHNVEFDDHGEPMEGFRDSVFLANSRFTADKYRATYGIESTIINPLFQSERYLVDSSRQNVLFINPHPLKGVDTALALAAACPDIPFDFVESWTLSDDQRFALQSRARELGNVAFHPRTNDMRKFYGRAKLVLVPSRWEETWGRVASEAHYSGIPVLGSRQGGLVEAVGPGGILLASDAPPADWIKALRSVWDDTALYRSLSAAALNYSNRPALDRKLQIDDLEEALRRAMRDEPGSSRDAPAPSVRRFPKRAVDASAP
jgi:glycosyltransferase involved in cell wall biosynthesis